MRYFPQLDGLRALSVILVLLFHLQVPGFSFGGFGVQIFFALSGFLITSILLKSKEDAGASFWNYLKVFYIRRALRIFPLYYLYLIINAIAAVAFGKSLNSYLYYVFYLQNYHLAATYFENPPGIIGHTWSLAVEEQFYLFWPVLVYFLSRRQLFAMSLVIALSSVVFRSQIFQATQNPFTFFVYLPSALDAICLGATFSVLYSFDQKKTGMLAGAVFALSAFGILAILLNHNLDMFWEPQSWVPNNGIFLFYVGLLAASLIVILLKSPLLARGFSSAPLVKIGQISYGLYIWHPICYQVIKVISEKIGFFGFATLVTVKLGLTLSVAWISYNVFETQFLKLKDKWKI